MVGLGYCIIKKVFFGKESCYYIVINRKCIGVLFYGCFIIF